MLGDCKCVARILKYSQNKIKSGKWDRFPVVITTFEIYLGWLSLCVRDDELFASVDW